MKKRLELIEEVIRHHTLTIEDYGDNLVEFVDDMIEESESIINVVANLVSMGVTFTLNSDKLQRFMTPTREELVGDDNG